MYDFKNWSILSYVVIILAFYYTSLIIYRLYLSPIARFPGPKLAAATKWYEFYYDVVLGGQYTFQIQRMHKQYGPIVRINPSEIHIQDGDYWDELYSRHKEYDRYAWILGRFGNNSSTSTTIRSDHHAILRAPLNPLFSKRSVSALDALLEEKVDLLANSIASDFAGTGRTLVLNDAFSAFAGDVVTTYCLGSCFDHLKSPGFKENFHAAYEGARKFAHTGLHFPSVFLLINLLPNWAQQRVVPGLFKMKSLQKDFISKIHQSLEEIEKPQDISHPIILKELAESTLSAELKLPPRLAAEIQQLIGAGVETVAWALTTTIFHLLHKPDTLEKLRSELGSVPPGATTAANLRALEQLPYLTAVIKEGLRLSTGVSVRLPRVSPKKPITYKGWTVPAGVPVSMTTLDTLYDERHFPEPELFCPERWLSENETEKSDTLSRYLVPFGRGSKMCLGINLAYAELYLSLSTLIRRFNFELYSTDISDVEIKHDYMVPSPKNSSEGVRVKVELR